MGGEHRLRREAQRAEAEAARWAQRARFAEERGLPDLAAEARERADRSAQQARTLLQRADELHAEVELLRGSVAAGRGPGPPPAVSSPSLEARLSALEVERELEELKQRPRGTAATPPMNEPLQP
jgi:hypothetical protein